MTAFLSYLKQQKPETADTHHGLCCFWLLIYKQDNGSYPASSWELISGKQVFYKHPEKYVGDARARLESVIGEGVVKLE